MSKIDWTKRRDPDGAMFAWAMPFLIGAAIAAIACLPFGFATGWASGKVKNSFNDCETIRAKNLEMVKAIQVLENALHVCNTHMQACRWAKK